MTDMHSSLSDTKREFAVSAQFAENFRTKMHLKCRRASMVCVAYHTHKAADLQQRAEIKAGQQRKA